jgi:hypothetical protein
MASAKLVDFDWNPQRQQLVAGMTLVLFHAF